MRNPFAAAATRLQRRASDGGGYYAGAAGGRLFYDFVMGTLSANTALRGSLQTLRNRSRELISRNAHASRIPQLYSEKVVGKDGITYSATVTSGDGSLDERANRELERAYYAWAESTYVTVDRSMCLPELEAADMEGEITDGETLIRCVDGFDNPFGFALELIDPDQLDHTYDVEPGPGRNAVIMGVEVDAWGQPVAYWLWKNHPSDRAVGGRVRVPASEIWHTYLRRRVRQRRGIPWFAPALVDFAHHGGWRENQLIASRAAAGKMGFLEPGADAEAWPDDEDDVATEGERLVVPTEVTPGGIERLPKGWSFKAHDPAFPATNFREFDSAILQSLAISQRVTYAEVSGDLRGTSYGSGRMGLLDVQNVYRWFQSRRVRRFNTPVLECFVRNALMSGALRLPSFDASRYLAATWHPQPQPWLAPKEDFDVRLAQRRAGLMSLTEIAAEQGRDIEEVFRQIQREQELARAYGITIDLSPSSMASQPVIPADPNTDPTTAADHDAPLKLIGGA
jgi:lambda family phage portal protein